MGDGSEGRGKDVPDTAAGKTEPAEKISLVASRREID